MKRFRFCVALLAVLLLILSSCVNPNPPLNFAVYYSLNAEQVKATVPSAPEVYVELTVSKNDTTTTTSLELDADSRLMKNTIGEIESWYSTENDCLYIYSEEDQMWQVSTITATASELFEKLVTDNRIAFLFDAEAYDENGEMTAASLMSVKRMYGIEGDLTASMSSDDGTYTFRAANEGDADSANNFDITLMVSFSERYLDLPFDSYMQDSYYPSYKDEDYAGKTPYEVRRSLEEQTNVRMHVVLMGSNRQTTDLLVERDGNLLAVSENGADTFYYDMFNHLKYQYDSALQTWQATVCEIDYLPYDLITNLEYISLFTASPDYTMSVPSGTYYLSSTGQTAFQDKYGYIPSAEMSPSGDNHYTFIFRYTEPVDASQTSVEVNIEFGTVTVEMPMQMSSFVTIYRP